MKCVLSHIKKGKEPWEQKDACFWEANELWAEEKKEVLISLEGCFWKKFDFNYRLVQQVSTLKSEVFPMLL